MYTTIMNNSKELDVMQLFHTQDVKQILNDFHIKHLWLAWSYARNEQKSTSDIDLIYEESNHKNLRWLWLVRLVSSLERITQRNIDIARKDQIQPDIKDSVLADCVKIF